MSYRFVFGASGAGKSHFLYQEITVRAQTALEGLFTDGPKSERPSGEAAAEEVRQEARGERGAGGEQAADGGASHFFYVVPDQYTMQTQQELVAATPAHGIMNIDVLGFGRLAHRIFEEIGAREQPVLNDMGKTLVLRRLAGALQKELPMIGASLHRPGYIAEVKSALSEFMQYGVGLQELDALIGYAQGRGALQARLRDLRRLYEAFLEYKRERFVTTEETLELLAWAAPQSTLLSRSVLVFDGFTGFTPVQLRVLCALMQRAREVVVSLTVSDDGGPSIAEVLRTGDPGPEEKLFHHSRKTARDLSRLAQEAGIEHGTDVFLPAPPVRFAGNPMMAHLEAQLFRYPPRPYREAAQEKAPDAVASTEGNGPALRTETAAGAVHRNETAAEAVHRNETAAGDVHRRETAAACAIRLAALSSPEEEARQMCIEIRRLTAERGYAYRDFAAVAGDLESYAAALEKMGARYGIPIYIDRTRTVRENPLSEAVRSALETVSRGFSYETAFRYLRSGLSGLSAQETDVLENYALARGIRSKKRWQSVFDEETEALRQLFLQELAPLQLPGGAAVTAGERVRALYRFLTGIQAQEKMERFADAFQAQGDLVREREYRQLYCKMVDLLDQIYDLLADEPMNAREFAELVEAGIGEIRVGTLPQQADRVLAGDVERTRLQQVRVLFVLGANDGNIPRSTGGGGILSELDREFLQGSGTELSLTPRQRMYVQRLSLYLNMTKPTDLLYLTYARASADGRTQRPSYLVALLRRLFPGTAVETPEEEPMAGRLAARRDSLSFLAAGLRDYADGYCDRRPEAMRDFLTVYGVASSWAEPAASGAPEADADADADGKELRLLTAAAFRRYRPRPLERGTAQRLYGRFLRGSVSRLETAAQCFCRQFLQYGMRLRERPEYRPTAVDAGNVLHAGIDVFAAKLRERGLSWEAFTREEGERLAGEAVEQTAAAYGELLLYSTARSAAAVERMKRIMARTVETLQYQLAKGAFVPEAYELAFGTREAPLGEIVVPLDPWGERGKIWTLGAAQQQGGGAAALPENGTLSEMSGAEDNKSAAPSRLYLNGRIDRLDLCRTEDGIYVKILDYKSGYRDLQPERIREGLQLQLMVYMEAALAMERALHPDKRVVPAAMLYYRFDDPLLPEQAGECLAKHSAQGQEQAGGRLAQHLAQEPEQAGERSAQKSEADGERTAALRKLLRPRGLVNASPSVITLLDRDPGDSSDVIPVGFKKDGTLKASSKAIGEEDFAALQEAAQAAMRRLGEEILRGNVTAAPRVTDGQSACAYCPYRQVCGFDLKLPGYKRIL